jgi:hypothetical protein
MSKYQPLSERLAGHPADEWRASFAEIEEVLGFSLPRAARNRAWWANNGDKAHNRAWMAPGWRAEMDQASGAVIFRRPVSEAALQGALQPDVVAAEEAPLHSRPKGWRVAAAIAAGAAVAAGVGALVLRGRMQRQGAERHT